MKTQEIVTVIAVLTFASAFVGIGGMSLLKELFKLIGIDIKAKWRYRVIQSEHVSEGILPSELWIFPLIDPVTKTPFIPSQSDIVKIVHDRCKRTYVYHNGKLCLGFPKDKESRIKYFNNFPDKRSRLTDLMGADPINFDTQNA